MNSASSSDLSDQIRSSIEVINYYDLFDKEIDLIITKLNKIFHTIKNQDVKIDKIQMSDSLKTLKEKYTTMSEHLVHNTFLDTNGNINEINLSVSKDTDELGEVEFF